MENKEQLLKSGENQVQLEAGMRGDELLQSDLELEDSRVEMIEAGVESGLLPDEEDVVVLEKSGWSFEEDEKQRKKMKKKLKKDTDRVSDIELAAVFEGDLPGYRKDI